MNPVHFAFLTALVLVLSIPVDARAGADPPRTKRAAAATWRDGGLQEVEVRGMDLAYVRPGASLAGYTKVLLHPISVGFRADWLRTQESVTRMRVRPEDVQRIGDELADLVREELLAKLGEGGYTLAEGPGDGVLALDLSIVDLYVTRPELPSPVRTETYAPSAGEMTLVGDLRDATSGETIMRLFDRAQGFDTERLHRITPVEFTAEARQDARAWALAIRQQLDLARGIGKPGPRAD